MGEGAVTLLLLFGQEDSGGGTEIGGVPLSFTTCKGVTCHNVSLSTQGAKRELFSEPLFRRWYKRGGGCSSQPKNIER